MWVIHLPAYGCDGIMLFPIWLAIHTLATNGITFLPLGTDFYWYSVVGPSRWIEANHE